MKQEFRPTRLSVCRLLLGFFLCFFALTGRADASEKPAELLIGLEPEHNIFDQVERYRVLAAYLSQELGVQVRLTIMSRYGEVLERFKARHLDGAILSSFTATRFVNQQHDAFTQGYIFVRRDSGIKKVEDMKGQSIVFVDPATTEGYLFPMVFLRDHGVEDIGKYFREYYFSGSHASAIFAVLDGKADIGCAKSSVFNRLTDHDPSIKKDLEIIAESPRVPETTLCIRKDLPADIKQKLLSILLIMDKIESGTEVLRKIETLRFINAKESDFSIVSDMIDTLENQYPDDRHLR